MNRVLDAMDLALPVSRAGLKAAIAYERGLLKLRGIGFAMRPAEEIPTAHLARIDVYYIFRHETIAVDPLRSALFLLRQVRWSLESGEPMRVLRALSGLSYLYATSGGASAERKAVAMLERVRTMTAELNTPDAQALTASNEAFTQWALGRMRESIEASHRAEELYRSPEGSRIHGGYFLRLSVMTVRVGALWELCEFREFASALQALMREARATENRVVVLQAMLMETFHDVLMDRLAPCLARLQAVEPSLPPVGFGIYHAHYMASVAHAAALSGEYEWGLGRLDAFWTRYQRSPMRNAILSAFRIQQNRTLLLMNAELSNAPLSGAATRALEAELSQLERINMRNRSAAIAATHRARLAYSHGDAVGARKLLAHAIDAATNPADAARARYVLGILHEGVRGEDLRAEAAGFFAERGARHAERYLERHFPELSVPEMNSATSLQRDRNAASS